MANLVVGTNSYSSVNDAINYFNDNLRGELWTVLSEDTQCRALITASQQISQAVKNDCKLPIMADGISASLMNATNELALAMALDSSVITQSDTGANIESLTAGSVEIEFFRPQSGSRFPILVMRFLTEGNCMNTNAMATPVATGTSSNIPVNDYNLTEGFK